MKRFSSILTVAASVAWAMAALAASRPHYGGTLHIAAQEAPQSLDPAGLTVPRSISQLVFETLVKLDEGHPQASLASSWQTEGGNQRWRFVLRSGVSFHDGAPLDANTVAASLRAGNPAWKVLATGDSVMIETESPDPNLLAELALSRNGVARRGDGKLSGTGPFAIAQWEAGKHLTLRANDQYWAGRPFLDSIEVELGKNSREQMMLMDLGKSDVIEIAPEDIRRAQTSNRVIVSSKPEELMALVFAGSAGSEDEIHLRNGLALSIDSSALNSVVFQAGGAPTGAMLPDWLSGYGFVFPTGGSGRPGPRDKAPSHLANWTLSYDAADSVAHVVTERVLLNARDAGITLQIAASGNADLRLVRIPLPSSDPQTALTELAHDFQLPSPKFSGTSVIELYGAESNLLQTRQVIPLLHLRSAVALRPTVHGLIMLPDGTLKLENVWLSPEKP
jgi:peptide/nickel transport system substrate-binding protein